MNVLKGGCHSLLEDTDRKSLDRKSVSGDEAMFIFIITTQRKH